MRKTKVATRRQWQREREIASSKGCESAVFWFNFTSCEDATVPIVTEKDHLSSKTSHRRKEAYINILLPIYRLMSANLTSCISKRHKEHDSNHLFYLFRTRLHFKLRAIDASRQYFPNQLDTIGNSRVYGCARNLRWCHSSCQEREETDFIHFWKNFIHWFCPVESE